MISYNWIDGFTQLFFFLQKTVITEDAAIIRQTQCYHPRHLVTVDTHYLYHMFIVGMKLD